MRALSTLAVGLLARAATADPRVRELAVARSMLALATLTVLVFTPTRALFAATPGNPTGVRCGGVRELTLWCLGGHAPWLTAPRLVVALVVLAAVVAGYRPRWTCVPHWYVTMSLGSTMTTPNGGDSVARIATMLLIPMCLGDRRHWHWRSASGPYPATWGGASYAAHLVLRLQVAVIYLSAVVAKLAVPSWRNGTYLGQVFQDPYYGPSAAIRAVLGPALGSRPIIAAATWGTMLVELAIAASMAGGPRIRRCGLALAVALHGMIIALIGLFSFGLAMFALVTLASGRTTVDREPDAGERTPTPDI